MPVKVAFAGAGGIADAHMSLLRTMDDVRIVAVSDIVQQKAESLASRYMARAYSDYRQMLANEEMDALYVCVPPYAHEEQEILAAQKGVHLFVEKPVALTMAKAVEIRDTIKENSIISSVGYHWRYQDNTDRARTILDGRRIGLVNGYWLGGMPEVSWWRKLDKSGGQIVEQAGHIIDLARFICGEIVEVYAAYTRRTFEASEDADIYDFGSVVLKFADGAVGTLVNTCVLNLPYTVGLHVVCSDTVVELHGDLTVIERGHKEILSGGRNPILMENEAFINAVRTGDSSSIRSSYEDAVKTLAVSLACNESAATNCPVAIDQ